jgi:hypothetical protein
MSVIRARVVNGRLQVDAPTSLPEGTVLNLVVDDEGDDLDACRVKFRSLERLGVDPSLYGAAGR